jgi:probable HAF family extracellular repeat protein
LYSGDKYRAIDDPLAAPYFPGSGNASGTVAKGINNSGDIIGYYWDAHQVAHGFLYEKGHYTTIDDPLAVNGTYLTGINNKGAIVGYYRDSLNNGHGFVYSHGAFTAIDPVVGVADTTLTGINDSGQVVGTYGLDGYHSFIGTPTGRG